MAWQHEYRRYQYPLNKDSLVFDVGGYKGEFTKNITELFGCNVHLFEPVPQFFNSIPIMPKVKMINAGLSDMTGDSLFNMANDASGAFASGETVQVKMISLYDYMKDEHIDHVDLIKINIEGGEYTLLYHILDKGLINQFGFIQVQWHNLHKYCTPHRNDIRRQLFETHNCTWEYPWIWESWERK